MAENPPSWVSSQDLVKISKEYQVIAYYNEMESALMLRKYSRVLMSCFSLFQSAIYSKNGLTIWHFKVIIRGLLLKPLITKR